MDNETKEIISEEKWLADLIGHQGWAIARKRLANKVLELQNAFSIEDSTPEKMVVDLNARKMASLILFNFLQEIEGSKEVVSNTVPNIENTFIERY